MPQNGTQVMAGLEERFAEPLAETARPLVDEGWCLHLQSGSVSVARRAVDLARPARLRGVAQLRHTCRYHLWSPSCDLSAGRGRVLARWC